MKIIVILIIFPLISFKVCSQSSFFEFGPNYSWINAVSGKKMSNQTFALGGKCSYGRSFLIDKPVVVSFIGSLNWLQNGLVWKDSLNDFTVISKGNISRFELEAHSNLKIGNHTVIELGFISSFGVKIKFVSEFSDQSVYRNWAPLLTLGYRYKHRLDSKWEFVFRLNQGLRTTAYIKSVNYHPTIYYESSSSFASLSFRRNFGPK